MPNYTHLAEFAGLPVLTFTGEDDPVPPDGPPVAWRVSTLSYEGEPFAEVFARFLEEVDTARLTALIIGCWGFSYDVHADVPLGLLTDRADRFPALRSLFFGEFTQEEAEISWINQTDVSPLLTAFPELTRLRVRGGTALRFSPVEHASLRHLAFETGGLPAEAVHGVLESRLPGLEHLELWLGDENYGGDTTIDDLRPLLDGAPSFPGLRELGLRNAPDTDALVGPLADSALLPRLHTLDLSLGTLGDGGAERLLAAPAFRALRRLDLHGQYLSAAAVERLRAGFADSGVAVELGDQREPYKWRDGSERRYPSVTE
ncbi:STM4015 family protein [Allonocardiopsis opalescens]|uniref:Leucine rich repeat (LRR) protein n=1 Tax=Allonocardiopsis opalescens TaxID=1144618 RepID=A0A2T0PU81_9ACTN|nr:STM4015 family protein [Allonocardiopsis opalescens]PRX92459.1 hypothetical protein CLV72_110220 [Allonocardiopsis opalescens]